jgi:hypothetical protein
VWGDGCNYLHFWVPWTWDPLGISAGDRRPPQVADWLPRPATRPTDRCPTTCVGESAPFAKCTGHGPRPRQHAVRALAVASGHGCEISILREHGTVGSGDRRLCQSGGSVDRWDRCEGGAAAACAAWHANYALEAQARQLGWSASAQALNPRSLARACPPTTSHEPQPRELGACRHKGHQPAQPPVPRHSRCKYGTPTAWV